MRLSVVCGLDLRENRDTENDKKMTVTRFELARETHHGDWLIPKRDAVTTWLHCR